MPNERGGKMLIVKNLSKRFDKTQAVDNFSFNLKPGEVLGLVGPNGAGKTTLIRCICGILRLDSGTVKICGNDLVKDGPLARGKLGYVAEVPYPYEFLTVWEHILFIARAYSIDDWEQSAENMLERFDLTDKKDELVTTLSKGMKQKLSIICTYIHNPDVLLLDEPIIGIDPKGVRYLKDLVRTSASEGKAILISSHMLDLIEKLCTRIIIMDKGKKLIGGRMTYLQRQARLGLAASFEDTFIKITEGDSNNYK
ncbi:MAG: ABC transporter ATP-binding protein [Thermoplasmata archaeon]|nr:ABC transporter ATP-binding protein [Thermoplasmata archaeon]